MDSLREESRRDLSRDIVAVFFYLSHKGEVDSIPSQLGSESVREWITPC